VSHTEKIKRVLALDVGTKRIGMAISDELGITAQGIGTLERKNKKSDFAHLDTVLERYGVVELVVGIPLRMSGEEGTQAGKIRGFAQELKERTGLPLHFWDERLTSAEAHRVLNEAGMTRLNRKGKVDQMAAIMILQGWMEKQRVGSD
jgi:putative Holliday junction resolvase